MLDKGNLKVVFSESWWKEKELLGLMNVCHPFDDKELTFGDLKKSLN